MLLVALFKLGVPSASSALIAGVAFLAGQLAAVAVGAASGILTVNQAGIATVFITGVLAAAAAGGIRATDSTADAKRVGTDVQAQRELTTDLGAKQEQEAKL